MPPNAREHLVGDLHLERAAQFARARTVADLGWITDGRNDRGRESLRAFVEKVFAQEPRERRRLRMGFLSDGSRVTWEYPREAGAGEQRDVVEVMEIRDGLIQHHRVYWGWYSVRLYETLKPEGAMNAR